MVQRNVTLPSHSRKGFISDRSVVDAIVFAWLVGGEVGGRTLMDDPNASFRPRAGYVSAANLNTAAMRALGQGFHQGPAFHVNVVEHGDVDHPISQVRGGSIVFSHHDFAREHGV
jgi:hypothetical protein